MKKTVKTISILCLGLVIATSFVACNLDSSMGIFEAIGNSEPVLDTTNQSILGFDGDYVYIKAQDGIYKYGIKNSDAERLNIALTTNGFASPIGDVTTTDSFVYQAKDGTFQKYTLSTSSASQVSGLTNVRAMNNGVALTGSPNDYSITQLPNSTPSLATLSGKGSAGILFGFTDKALTTMITEHKNKNNATVYEFSYYWNNQQLTFADNTSGDLAKLVVLDGNYAGSTNTNFLRIQAFQPATEAGPGVAIAKIANDNYTSLIFIHESKESTELKYVGQSNFYLNYYSPSSVPSARVTINNKQYMLFPYSSGLRLIDLKDESTIEKTATKAQGNNASDYGYLSATNKSFAQGFTYNNVVDIKPIPESKYDSTDLTKNKYLVSTVKSGVFTITLPSEAGFPSDDTKNGERSTGYHPIPTN